MNGISYNIQWGGQCLIIVDNNKRRIDTPPFVDESAEMAITGYLVCLARKEGVKQIHFILAQYIV